MHTSVFPIEKLPKDLNFQTLFTSNRPFGGYFQWNACTDFQKKCSWTRYSDAKLIKNIKSHSSGLALEKEPKNVNFQFFFTSNRLFGGYSQWNACTDYQKTFSWTRYINAKWIKNIANFLVASLCFFNLEQQPKI